MAREKNVIELVDVQAHFIGISGDRVRISIDCPTRGYPFPKYVEFEYEDIEVGY